jgi:hypothetical protein
MSYDRLNSQKVTNNSMIYKENTTLTDVCAQNAHVVTFMVIFIFSYSLFWTMFAEMGAERHSKTTQNHLNDLLFGMIIFSTIFTLGNYKTYKSKDFLYLIMGLIVTLTIWSFISKIKFFQFDLANMGVGQISCIVFLVAAIIAIASPLLKIHITHPSIKLFSMLTLLITLLILTFTSQTMKVHHYQIFGILAVISNVATSNVHLDVYSKVLSGLCLGSVSHGISAYNATGIGTESTDKLIN